MAQDTLLGFPAHTLPYRCGKFITLSTASEAEADMASASLFALSSFPDFQVSCHHGGHLCALGLRGRVNALTAYASDEIL